MNTDIILRQLKHRDQWDGGGRGTNKSTCFLHFTWKWDINCNSNVKKNGYVYFNL